MKKFTKFCLLLAIFIIAGNWAYSAQVTVTVGTGTNVTSAYESAITPFGTNYEDGQNQMLFTALELNIAGIGAGDITEIGWNVGTASATMNGFNIEMKHTSATSATSFESGFTNVYSTAYTPVAGWNVITLTTPFYWDGTSNLLVKVCFDNTSYVSSSTVYYTAGSYTDMNAYAYADNAAGCSLTYSGTTNRPNTRITGEEFTGMLPPGVPTNPSPADGATNVAVSGDLTWDFGSDTDTYDLWYGPAGSMIQVVTGEIAGATGLYSYAADYFSTYEWQVIAYNSAKGTTNGPVWTFKTKCDVFTAPFSENFDGVTPPALPDCWSKIENPSYGYVQTYANYSYSAPNCVRMRKTNLSYRFILITPELSDLTSQSNRIRFQGQALTTVQDIIVGTMSDPTDVATFTAYQTITLSLNSYTEYTINFDANYTLTDKYIAFEDASTSIYRIMTVDDFVYEPIPSCIKPTDLTATNNGITSVYLGWTENNSPPATSWEIEYGDQGFAQGTGTTVIADANPFHLTGLTINHDYSFYVRTNCGVGDYSAWTGPFDFSTIDGKATNPDPANNATFVLITAKTFNWDDVIDADNYTIDIGTATGLADLVDDAFCATSDYTYTGADWDYNEDYYWTVTTVYTAKADVTGDEWKFTTECDAVSTFPWTEGFENGGAIPSCWSQEYESGAHDWVFQNGGLYSHPANAHSGSYNAAFTHTSSGIVTKLVTPALDLSGLTSPKLTFWHAQEVWSPDQDELRVYYKTSAGGTWTLIPGAVWINNIPSWTEETFTLPSPGSDYYIAFEGTDNFGYGVVVDDVSVYSDIQTSTWTGGATSGNWFLAGNWDNGVPGAGDDVTIPAGMPFDPVIDLFEAECAALTIETGVTFTIAELGGLNASGTVLCDGDFVMLSDASGNSAGFRDGGIDPLSTGSFLFDRMIEVYDPLNDHLGWHYIASPITGFDNWDMFNYWINWWNEPATGVDPDFPWVHMEGTFPCIPAPQQAIGDMEGWSVRQDYDYACNATNPGTDDHILFAGAFADVNTGNYDRDYTNAGGHSATGYNLMGNPYASWIDMAAFAGMNVHIWDGSADDYLDWADGGDFTEIPPTQGFFVYDGGAGNIALTNANRVFGTQPFEKSAMNEVVLRASGNNKEDKTYIRFSENVTAGYDNAGVDAYKLLGTGTAPQIYTVTNGVEFSINTLQETPMVPMSFFAAQSAEYTISAIETSDFANVVLEDRFTGEQTNLLTDSYTFNYTVNDDPDRFFVHFTPLGIPELSANSIDIWSNDHNIYVQALEINGYIVVFNMMGQEVIRAEIESGINMIPVTDVNAFYVVKLVGSKITKTGKVYVK
jgi:hypothetical protein